MNLFILLVCFELGLLLWSFLSKHHHYKARMFVRIGELVLLILLFSFKILAIGIPYYFLTALFVTQVLFSMLRLKKLTAKEYKITRQIILSVTTIILYLVAFVPLVIFPEYDPPVVTGPYPVKEALYTWVDESRVETFSDTGVKRELTVKLWFPDSTEGKFPLLVFSHGAFGIIDSNTSTCRELASHGYIVASIAHPYHAMYVKSMNGKITFANSEFIQSIYAVSEANEERVYSESQKWMKLRTDDENFVLDILLSKADNKTKDNLPFSLIDTSKIGLFGHSMGGASSAELGRLRSDISAIVILEGTMFGEYQGVSNGIGIYDPTPYPIPVLDIYSENIYHLAKQSPDDTYANFFVAKHAIDYRYVIFKNAGHLNFTDLPLVSPFLASFLGVGTVDATDCIQTVNHVILTYFDSYLKGNGMPDLEKEY